MMERKLSLYQKRRALGSQVPENCCPFHRMVTNRICSKNLSLPDSPNANSPKIMGQRQSDIKVVGSFHSIPRRRRSYPPSNIPRSFLNFSRSRRHAFLSAGPKQGTLGSDSRYCVLLYQPYHCFSSVLVSLPAQCQAGS